MKYSGSSSFFTTCETIFSIRLNFAFSRSLHYTGIWVRETWPRFLCRKIRWMNENLVLLPESSPRKWTSWKTSLLKCLAQRKKKLLHSKYCSNMMFMDIVKILHWKIYFHGKNTHFCNREKCLSKVQPCFILIYSLCPGVFLTKLSSRDCCRLETNLLLFPKFSVSLHQIKSYPMRKTSEGTNREPCCCFVLMVLFDMYNKCINSPFGAFSHPNR